MLSYLKNEWSNSSTLTKLLNFFSIFLICISIYLFINSILKNNTELHDDFISIQSHLKSIEQFDKIFSGKWRHYLTEAVNISTLKQDMKDLNLSNLRIKLERDYFILDGQISSIRELLNLISYYYNVRGLVINELNIDVISDDLINIDLSLIF